MFCANCGASLENEALFCPICGEKVTQPQQPEEPVLSTEPEETVPETQPEALAMPELDMEVPQPEAEDAPVPAEPMPELIPQPPVPAPAEPVPEPAPAEPLPPVEPLPIAPPVAPQPPVAAKPPVKKPYKPHVLLQIPLQFLSFILTLVLLVSLFATVALADLNHLMSAGGIKQLINAVLIPTSAPHHIRPAVGALGVRLDDASPIPGFTIPGDLDIGLDDIPEDIFAGGGVDMDGLVDWIYNAVEEATGEPLPITKEQVEEFIAESTVSDFVSEKLAGYAEDFINGTENTSITTEEVLALLDENHTLLEEKFQVEITPEVKENLSSAVEDAMAETDLNTVIREQVFETVQDSIDQTMQGAGMSWEQLQPLLQSICSDATLYTAIGICVALMLLICLLNFYNIPGGLTWIAVPCLLAGTLLTLPLLLMAVAPELLVNVLPAAVSGLLASFAWVLMPFHAAVLIVGFVLLLVSVIWRSIRTSIRRRHLRASVA